MDRKDNRIQPHLKANAIYVYRKIIDIRKKDSLVIL